MQQTHRNIATLVCIFMASLLVISKSAYSQAPGACRWPSAKCDAAVKYPRPPATKNVTIANGGLSITFNIAWGGVVVAVADKNVAHGLNIVDTHDVGRELQVDQFLKRRMAARTSLMINPTQAGALGQQAFYQHPKGVLIREMGSSVVRWKAGRSRFYAVIRPLDYDTGNSTKWTYVEHVRINKRGVATFHYIFHDHNRTSYMMSSEVPTLYSDRTDAFMYPVVSPYGRAGLALRRKHERAWPVKMITGAPRWPQNGLVSKGWIANIDTANDLGIFYTTPLGFPESYGTFPGAYVSDAYPLGKTNVVATGITARPGLIYSIRFSVLVSTPQRGPILIAKQPRAIFKILRQ